MVLYRSQKRLDCNIDGRGTVVGTRIKHPNVDNESHCVEPRNVGKDEAETIVYGGQQSKYDPVSQPYLFLLLISLFDGLNATLLTLQDMQAGQSIPNRVVRMSGRTSKTARSVTPNATVRNNSEGLKPDFVEMVVSKGTSERSLLMLVIIDFSRGFRSLLIFKYGVWTLNSQLFIQNRSLLLNALEPLEFFVTRFQWEKDLNNATQQQQQRMDQLNEVVKYILYRCRENNTPITEIMANFVAQTVYNPRTEKFYLEDKLSESEMRELKEAAIKRIFAKDSLEMKIIAMQINYDTEFLETELRKQTETQNEAIASGEHTDEVINHEVKNAKDFEGLSQLYKKIYNYLLFKNRAITDRDRLDQNRPKIEKEVAAALQSVIPRAALAPFVTLSSSEKLIQLVELSNLVIGIRLFNQEIGKGGSGLLKASELLNNQAQNVREEVFREVEDVTQLCEKYGQIMRVFQRGKLELQNSEFRRLRNELTFIRQYKSFLVSLAEEIESSESAFDSNSIKYGKEIDDLKQLLGSKSSAPKEQVYPKFAILAQSYVSIFEERKYFEDKVKLYALLKEFRKSFPLSLSQKFYEKAADIFNGLPQESAADIEEDPNSGIEIFLQSSSPDFMQKDCDYLGFCIWSIVKHNGLLIPGEPGLGVYKYKDKNCVFSSTQAITDFMKEPQLYILGILDQCRKNPELIYFLRLEDSFKNVKLSLVNQAVQGGIKNKLMVDKGIETPVHFVEKNIDPNYCWNEWELRKKAIQMANIRKTQTRGDQTLLSNFKVDSDTQTYLKKDAETNTVKNTGTQYKAQKHSIGV